MINKITSVRVIAVVGLIFTILAGIVGQDFHTAMGYYFREQPQFDYVWLTICTVLSLYFLVVILRGRFSLLPKRNNG